MLKRKQIHFSSHQAKLVPFENAEVANEQLSDQEVSIVVSQRKLSPEAANVEQKIASIEVNKALKPEEKEKQLDAVVDSMPDRFTLSHCVLMCHRA